MRPNSGFRATAQGCAALEFRRSPSVAPQLIKALDEIIEHSLRQLANDTHVSNWRAKERDWVNYFAHRYLITHCAPDGPLKEPARIGIEVAVPQPPGYIKPGVSRDLVIWKSCGDTCFDDDRVPRRRPLAILECKVHRPKHRNVKVGNEREWLRNYCTWQPSVVSYAVEVDGTRVPGQLVCSRFLGTAEDDHWLELSLEASPSNSSSCARIEACRST